MQPSDNTSSTSSRTGASHSSSIQPNNSSSTTTTTQLQSNNTAAKVPLRRPVPPPPPNRRPPWVTIDIRDDFVRHRALLHRFYDSLMRPMFPMPNELDDLDSWEKRLDSRSPHFTEFHVLLVFDPKDTKQEDILAGVIVEYYPECRCGLISYIVVSPRHRDKGLSRFLIDEAMRLSERDAWNTTRAGMLAMFLETNSPERIRAEDDVVPPAVRVQILSRLGFRRLLMDFVQPPLSDDKDVEKSLWLAVYSDKRDGRIDTNLVVRFLDEYWYDCVGDDWHLNEHYRHMMKSVAGKSTIPFVDLTDYPAFHQQKAALMKNRL